MTSETCLLINPWKGAGMAQPRIELATMNHHYMFYDLDDFFANAQKLGYPCVELWTSPQHFFMDYRQNDPIERLSPVSYTHLDVYKRQPLYRALLPTTRSGTCCPRSTGGRCTRGCPRRRQSRHSGRAAGRPPRSPTSTPAPAWREPPRRCVLVF